MKYTNNKQHLLSHEHVMETLSEGGPHEVIDWEIDRCVEGLEEFYDRWKVEVPDWNPSEAHPITLKDLVSSGGFVTESTRKNIINNNYNSLYIGDPENVT